MTVLLTLTVAGVDTGPFDLYSNLDGFTTAFQTGVTKAALQAGYSSTVVPDYATIIRVQSKGHCSTYNDIVLTSPTTSSTATLQPTFRAWHFSSPGRPDQGTACNNMTFTNVWYTNYQVGTIPAMGSVLYSSSALTNPPINGGNNWFHLQESLIDGSTVYQIGVGGTLDNFFECV